MAKVYNLDLIGKELQNKQQKKYTDVNDAEFLGLDPEVRAQMLANDRDLAAKEIARADQVYSTTNDAGALAWKNRIAGFHPQTAEVKKPEVTQAPATTSDPVVTASAPPTTPTYSPTYKGPDIAGMTSKVNSIYDNRYNSEIEKIRQARDTANQGYNSMATQAAQGAYNNRNQADVGNVQAAQRLKELMAQNGLLSSGDNVSANVGLETSRQAGINDINQVEAGQLQNIAEQRALLANQAAGQETALMQAVNSDRAAALYNLMQLGDDRAFQMENVNYGRYRDGVNDQFRSDESDWQRQMAVAQLMGQFNGESTLGGQQMALQNRQANLDAALQVGNQLGRAVSPTQTWGDLYNQPNAPLTGEQQRWQQSFGAQEAQRQWDNTFKEGQFDFQKAQQLWDNNFKDRSFQQSVSQFAQSLGMDYAKMNQAQQQFVAEQAYKSEAMKLNQAQFDWSKDPGNPDNAYKQAQIDAARNKKPEVDPNQIMSTYVGNVDRMDSKTRQKFFDAERANIIRDVGLDVYNDLYKMYYDQYGNPLKK